jgi:hypothetical protein
MLYAVTGSLIMVSLRNESERCYLHYNLVLTESQRRRVLQRHFRTQG